jgi:16S rRNA G1207 methylase RsmC
MRRGVVRFDELLAGGEVERADEVVIAPPTWRGHSFIELCEWLVCAKLAHEGARATWIAPKRGGATGVRKVLETRGWEFTERKDGDDRVFDGVVPAAGIRPEPRVFVEDGVEFAADWGVFSREHIDEGTRVLLEAAMQHDAGFVVDVGTGYGPLPILLSKAGRCTRAIGTDIDLVALYLARRNAIANDVDVAFMALADPTKVDASPLTLCEIPTHTPDTDALVAGLTRRSREGVVLVAVHRGIEERYRELFGGAPTIASSGTHAVLKVRT